MLFHTLQVHEVLVPLPFGTPIKKPRSQLQNKPHFTKDCHSNPLILQKCDRLVTEPSFAIILYRITLPSLKRSISAGRRTSPELQGWNNHLECDTTQVQRADPNPNVCFHSQARVSCSLLLFAFHNQLIPRTKIYSYHRTATFAEPEFLSIQTTSS